MAGSGPTNSLRGYLVLSLAWLAVTALVYFVARRPAPPPIQILPPPTAASPSPSSPAPVTTAVPTPTAPPLRIDVVGAVQAPGVYRLPLDSIVADAIAAAGGPANDAALDRLNKAAPLLDGMQVFVPHLSDSTIPTPLAPAKPAAAGPPPLARAATLPSGAPGLPDHLVDLNRASAEELEALPGIGPALAGRILAGRPYAQVDDLLHVAGIGEATLAKLKPYVIVR